MRRVTNDTRSEAHRHERELVGPYRIQADNATGDRADTDGDTPGYKRWTDAPVPAPIRTIDAKLERATAIRVPPLSDKQGARRQLMREDFPTSTTSGTPQR